MRYSVSIQGGPQKLAPFLYVLPLPNINLFPKLFHCQNQQSLKSPPHLKCVATLPCEMSEYLKATIENKKTSVTHLQKLATGNNVFIVSVIV